MKASTKTDVMWPIRKDDTFPYAQGANQFWNGFYTSRPHHKRNYRELSIFFHSSQRLVVQQVLRLDLSQKAANSFVEYQTSVLDVLGNVQHHDAITGTSRTRVSGDFNDRAALAKKSVLQMNAKLLIQKLEEDHGVKITGELDTSMGFRETLDDLTSPYAHQNQLLFAVQNPTAQKREEVFEIELPYYNYTMWEVVNGTEVRFHQFDKYLPRTLLNSNRSIVKSYAQLFLTFKPEQLTRVFVAKNLGVIRQKNLPPLNYRGGPIWNLNLPLYLQKEAWEINNYQSNFAEISTKHGWTLKAGTKSLQFVEVIPGKTPKERYNVTRSGKKNVYKDEGPSEPNSWRSKALKASENNAGAALFVYKDSATGVSQTFAFNLRYYIGAADFRVQTDGLYEFAVEGKQYQQRSYPYGKISSVYRRGNSESAEFLIHWSTSSKLNPEAPRASARVKIHSAEDFVKFHVELNSIPIKADRVGKDVLVDWYFLDDFDSGGNLWVDANGLQMVDKKLFSRKEYRYNSTATVPANWYPITSAIAIRDVNTSSPFGKLQRQITILNDRSQGGSAGLRGNKNIELMQHRRFKKHDTYGLEEPVNDLDIFGKGIQVPATYHLIFTNRASQNERASISLQREVQRKIDQPLLTFYSHSFSLEESQAQNQNVSDGFVKNNGTNISLHMNGSNSSRTKLNHSNQTHINTTQEIVIHDAQPGVVSPALPPIRGSEQEKALKNSKAKKVEKDKLSKSKLKKKKEQPTQQSKVDQNRAYKQSKTLKTIVFAEGQNEVLVRIINLDDRFDGNNTAKTQYLDLNMFGRDLFKEANQHLIQARKISKKLLKQLRINITEMNLAGSIAKAELTDNEDIKWVEWKTPAYLDPPLMEPPADEIRTKEIENLKNKSQRAHIALMEKNVSNASKASNASNTSNISNFSHISYAQLYTNAVNRLKDTYTVGLEPQKIRVFKLSFYFSGGSAQIALGNEKMQLANIKSLVKAQGDIRKKVRVTRNGSGKKGAILEGERGQEEDVPTGEEEENSENLDPRRW